MKRIGLTGTPIQNDLQELWAVLDALVELENQFRDRKVFRKYFTNPIKLGSRHGANRKAVRLKVDRYAGKTHAFQCFFPRTLSSRLRVRKLYTEPPN